MEFKEGGEPMGELPPLSIVPFTPKIITCSPKKMETVITLYFPAELQLDYEKINRMCGFFFYTFKIKWIEVSKKWIYTPRNWCYYVYQRKYKICLKFKYCIYKILSPLFKPSHIMCLLILKVEFISNTINIYSAIYNTLWQLYQERLFKWSDKMRLALRLCTRLL